MMEIGIVSLIVYRAGLKQQHQSGFYGKKRAVSCQSSSPPEKLDDNFVIIPV